MKFTPLIWAGLWRKRMRTVLTIVSLMIAFVLFGLLTTVDEGFRRTVAVARLNELSVNARFGTVPVPYAYREEIARIPGVTAVSGRAGLFGFYQDRKNFVWVMAADEDYFAVRDQFAPSPTLIAELHRSPQAAFATAALAKKHGWKAGDRISIEASTVRKDGSRNWEFDILGIIDNRDNPGLDETLVTNYRYIDEERGDGLRGSAWQFFVRIVDPAQSVAISRRIVDMYTSSSAPVQAASDRVVTERGLSSLGNVTLFLDLVIAAVFFMLLFLTGTAITQSVRERVPEFAVLQIFGFSPGGVAAVVIAETAFQCLLGAALGLAAAAAIAPLVLGAARLPMQPVMPWSVAISGMAAALGVTLLTALPALWRLARVSPIMALSRLA